MNIKNIIKCLWIVSNLCQNFWNEICAIENILKFEWRKSKKKTQKTFFFEISICLSTLNETFSTKWKNFCEWRSNSFVFNNAFFALIKNIRMNANDIWKNFDDNDVAIFHDDKWIDENLILKYKYWQNRFANSIKISNCKIWLMTRDDLCLTIDKSLTKRRCKRIVRHWCLRRKKI